VAKEQTYLEWLCVCCGVGGPGNPTMHPKLDQHHNRDCPERANGKDPEAVRELKARLAKCCGNMNVYYLRAIDAEIRERKLQEDVEQLRSTLKAKDRDVELARMKRRYAEDGVELVRLELLRVADELRQLRAFKAATQVAVYCPNCKGTSAMLVASAPDQDIYRYACQKCRTEFNA
jgi:hypothetical protein